MQWLEQLRQEDEAGVAIDWRLAEDPAVASVARAVLEQGAIALGPVRGIGTSPAAEPPGSTEGAVDPGTDGADGASADDPDAVTDAAAADPGGIPAFAAGVLVTLALVLVGAIVALRIRRRRMVPPWLR